MQVIAAANGISLDATTGIATVTATDAQILLARISLCPLRTPVASKWGDHLCVKTRHPLSPARPGQILLFCNPRNPGGTVYRESEVCRLADIAEQDLWPGRVVISLCYCAQPRAVRRHVACPHRHYSSRGCDGLYRGRGGIRVR